MDGGFPGAHGQGALCCRHTELLVSLQGCWASREPSRVWLDGLGFCDGVENSTVTCLHASSLPPSLSEWDVETGKCLKTFKHKDPILATRINDIYIVSSCERGLVKVWHVVTAQLVKVRGRWAVRGTGHWWRWIGGDLWSPPWTSPDDPKATNLWSPKGWSWRADEEAPPRSPQERAILSQWRVSAYVTHIVTEVVGEGYILTQHDIWAQGLLTAAEVKWLFLFQNILPWLLHGVREWTKSQWVFSLLSGEKSTSAVLKAIECSHAKNVAAFETPWP